ncbi:MAG TPA: Ig-like domain-containing protein, partial [Pseudomonadales bacterium]|nr:Ig-like domain-containing protein [Pseudomonadales bacterium]
ANINIQAAVTNGTAPVTSVKFFTGTTLLTTESTGPFSTTANNLPAGNYALSAIAGDSSGLSATNTVNISVVTPIAVTLTNLTVSHGTNFQFSYGANVGLNYVIQRATSLAPPNWVPIATNIAASNPTNYMDTHATGSPAFYRVGQLPNP